ncbi:calpain-10 isoform X4 [Manis javanica]|uniref:calpain-10 isoform X4 n=1 Tax=Manis javanica TaxID=9974 RepID=UPI003C6D4375
MRAPARELFRDAAFPAADSSLFSSFSTPLARFREDITWRRPQEICATPQLFADNPQEGQVKQGLLGDCWLLCACAALQKSQHLLNQVIPPGQPSWLDQTYRGAFTFRVWQFGRWVEVTVDDRLPCLAGRLCFSRCRRADVFWLPLLEKNEAGLVSRRLHRGGSGEACWGDHCDRVPHPLAKARDKGLELERWRNGCPQLRRWLRRVHGSYEHLWAGQVADALVDLTGGLAERWTLKDLARASGHQDRPGNSEHRACRQLLGLKDRCLISCAVLSPREGAKGGACWTPRMCPSCSRSSRKGSSGWRRMSSSRSSTRSPLASRSRRPAICRASTQVLRHTQELPGAWVEGQSAGGCRNNSGFPSNPKFWLRVLEPSEVYVAVLQRPRVHTLGRAGWAQAPAGNDRAVWSPVGFPSKDYQAVGLHIWKVEKRRVSLPRVLSSPPVAGTVCHAYDREIHLRCELAPGYYLAVPSTFLKDVPGQFLLRVFSSGRVSLSAIKPVAQSPAPREALPLGEWETVRLRGSWRLGQTAGGSRNFASYPTNPCFPLSVPEGAGPRCIRISLQQDCQDGKCHPIGFHIFQVPPGGRGPGAPSLLLQEPLLSCVPHRYAQEVSRLCHLPAGSYRIVPSTYLPDSEGVFTVTIATRIDRRSIHSQEALGQLLQEASFTAVMKT